MEASHTMSAPVDIEKDIEKYMAKLELESRLASTQLYMGESVFSNWSNVELLLEERESIRSQIAQLESGHNENLFSHNRIDEKIQKMAVGRLRNSLQDRNQVIDSLCSKWFGLLCKVNDGELRWHYNTYNVKESADYKENMQRKIATHIIRSRNGYKEYESGQNAKLEEFLDDVATLHGRIFLLMIRWINLNNAFSKVSQGRSESGVKHQSTSDLLIQGILYQLNNNQYRIAQLEAENKMKESDISTRDRKLTALEKAAKLNKQKLIDLEQNLAAKDEQIIQIRACFEPIAKDMKDYVRGVKTQWDKKQEYFVKKLKRSALRAIKAEHEMEKKNIKFNKQINNLKGQWKYFSQGTVESEKKHFQSLRLGQELANRKVDQRIASLEETIRNEMVEVKKIMCMENQRELDKLKIEQEDEWHKITRDIEDIKNKQKMEVTNLRNEFERKLISTVPQAKVLKKGTGLGKEGKRLRRVKVHGKVYARRGSRSSKNSRHRRLYNLPMKARKHSRQRLEIERHPRHEVKYEEESGLVKKSLLKEEKLSVSHSFLEKDNHAHIAQVRNRSTSSDQIVVKDENSKQVKMKNTRGNCKIGSLSQCCKGNSQGFFEKHQDVPLHYCENLTVGRKPIRSWSDENIPSKVLMKYCKWKHCFGEFPLNLPTDSRTRPKYHRTPLWLEMSLEVKFVVRWKDDITVILERRIISLMGIW